jgi:hypothetical protein
MGSFLGSKTAAATYLPSANVSVLFPKTPPPPNFNVYRNVSSELLLVTYSYYILIVNIAERLVAQGIIMVSSLRHNEG